MAEEDPANILVQCEEKVNQKDVMALVIKHLKLLSQITVTPFETREKVWNFYHQHSQESTNTTTLARTQITGKPRIQDGLEFKTSVQPLKNHCGIQFYHSIWMTVIKTYR